MLFSKPTKASLDAVVTRYLPAAQAAGCVSALEGLSGTSYRVETGAGSFTARKLPEQRLPGISLRRHHLALRQLPAGIAPEPWCLAEGWLFTRWLDGEVLPNLPPLTELTGLLYYLHRQKLFGWRISLIPLLEFYWQESDPNRRTLAWLRELKRLKRRKEPRPLRLAPLHMDIHAGNLVRQPGYRLGLIDWEYAGDGDIALELAAVLAANAVDSEALLAVYAAQASLSVGALRRQVARWQPWMTLLMASWYECRWRQTGEHYFITLADDAWRALRASKHQERELWAQ
ncbi:thiamine kinase [Cedecea neteri]|uniref:thiamine kinase n=1 Tax=Cedecea neteri TaxID=158822 RepID=UPI002AA66859|nr:thiamine kinase [Cedecea neteri]WPU21370.1 thiamine kinase [Cedecea neteri]